MREHGSRRRRLSCKILSLLFGGGVVEYLKPKNFVCIGGTRARKRTVPLAGGSGHLGVPATATGEGDADQSGDGGKPTTGVVQSGVKTVLEL
jgi:hypothetical protein